MNLVGRIARCPYCKTEVSSSLTLAFFEYRGEGSESAETCVCGYSERAHDPAYMGTLTPSRDGSRRTTVVEDGRCKNGGYSPRGDVGFDSFYCGCRGWD